VRSRIEVFFISLGIWALLIWPSPADPGGWDPAALAAGALGSALVSFIFGREFSTHPERILHPRRWYYAILFLPVFAYYCLKSSLQVIYLVIHPQLPIKPGIVKIRTKLKNPAAISILANCITLTPGTLTVEATPEGVLYVHWINVKSVDEKEAGRLIAGKFEHFLQRIFEEPSK